MALRGSRLCDEVGRTGHYRACTEGRQRRHGRGDANLFKKKPIEAPRSQLDHFVIKQVGKADEKDTILTFEIRAPFSTDLWMWTGQQSGEEFDVVFEVIGQEEFVEDVAVLVPPPDDEEEEDEDDASEDTPIEDIEDDDEAIKRHTKNLLKM